MESYNRTRHSATKMSPISVNWRNAAKARENIRRRYGNSGDGKDGAIKKPKYKVGDLVRVSRARNVFAKGYEGGWTLELFKIVRISTTRPPTVYFLKDLSDEDIDGFFYEEELSRVQKNLNKDFFEVNEVLKSRGKGRKKEYLVSWKGYPEKFNSWIKASDLKDV